MGYKKRSGLRLPRRAGHGASLLIVAHASNRAQTKDCCHYPVLWQRSDTFGTWARLYRRLWAIRKD